MEEKTTIFQKMAAMPQALQRRVWKQLGCTALVTLCICFFALYFKSWTYLLGILLGLYPLYLAYHIIQRFYRGQIICKKMVCIRAIRTKLLKERAYCYFRDLESPPDSEEGVHAYYIAASEKELGCFTPNTLMNLYYDVESPKEILAWAILGTT